MVACGILTALLAEKDRKCAYRWVSEGRLGWRSVLPELLLESAGGNRVATA